MATDRCRHVIGCTTVGSMSLGLKQFQPSIVMKYSYQRIGRHLDFLDRLPPFPVLFISTCSPQCPPQPLSGYLSHPSIAHFFLSFSIHLQQVKTCKIIYSFVVPNKCGPILRSTPHLLLHIAPVLSFALFYSSTIHSQAQSHIVQPDIRNSPDCQYKSHIPLL